ncbi:hypothetical protein DQ384_26115 [Sphaerisporangium album]|uniref:Uncharacterized protein n=1 Tax=Sphaerisporangium album TaxID=509200 RepID=A0A367FBX3_9ACTN|nr:hypothetical protein [Sphaerisporangium album]RCG27197.1 hypothetical protein DQ384_26115 [Sphaerisporangium album]
MSSDPDIQRAWNQLYDGVRRELGPFVAAVSLEDLVKRIVSKHIAGPGWRPPLNAVPDVVARARAANAHRALGDHEPGGPA